jgi:hypothetical protein
LLELSGLPEIEEIHTVAGDSGVMSPYAVEIISKARRALSLKEAAKRSFATTMAHSTQAHEVSAPQVNAVHLASLCRDHRRLRVAIRPA